MYEDDTKIYVPSSSVPASDCENEPEDVRIYGVC